MDYQPRGFRSTELGGLHQAIPAYTSPTRYVDRRSKQEVPRVCKRSPRASQTPCSIPWTLVHTTVHRSPVTGPPRYEALFAYMEKLCVRRKCTGLRQGNIVVKVETPNDRKAKTLERYYPTRPTCHRPCTHQSGFSTRAVCSLTDTHLLAIYGFSVIKNG